MKIFVSWSGDLSHQVALFLKEWFPNVIQTVDLYVSSEDIDKGARWFAEVGTELAEAQFGIVCLTKENMQAPWVLFEAGAISKTVNQSRVIPLLIDLSPPDLKGPLVQFQAATVTEPDVKKLTKTINEYSENPLRDAQLDKIFSKWWPDLEQFLREVTSTLDQTDTRKNQRSERELIEEVLQHVRAIARALPNSMSQKSVYTPRSFAGKIRRGLEDRGKPLLAAALEGAQKVTLEGDELHVEFTPAAKHLCDALRKPESMRILRDAAIGVIGRNVGVSIIITEVADNFEEQEELTQLRERAEQHPAVQQLLKTFRSEIVEVRAADDDQPRLSSDSFND
jgi:arsenate reductase-like glutaredoxin family protein